MTLIEIDEDRINARIERAAKSEYPILFIDGYITALEEILDPLGEDQIKSQDEV